MSRPTEHPNAVASLEYAEAMQAAPAEQQGEKNLERDDGSSEGKQEERGTTKQPIEQDDGVTRIEALCESQRWDAGRASALTARRRVWERVGVVLAVDLHRAHRLRLRLESQHDLCL